MAHDKDLISLYQELKASITSFYSTHSVLHTNGTIDIQEVLNKMSKVDLFLASDFKGLWEMERAERLKPDDLSTIQEEQTVILNPEECSQADPLTHIETQWFHEPRLTAEQIIQRDYAAAPYAAISAYMCATGCSFAEAQEAAM